MHFRSAESVVDEIDLVRGKAGIAFFSLRDDTFTARKSRIKKLCDELARRRIFVLWNWKSRVNLVDEELFFRGDPRQLSVRKDPHTQDDFVRLVEEIDEQAAEQRFTREEIEGYLALTDRCYSALLDLAAWCEAHGLDAEAERAYREIIDH